MLLPLLAEQNTLYLLGKRLLQIGKYLRWYGTVLLNSKVCQTNFPLLILFQLILLKEKL